MNRHEEADPLKQSSTHFGSNHPKTAANDLSINNAEYEHKERQSPATLFSPIQVSDDRSGESGIVITEETSLINSSNNSNKFSYNASDSGGSVYHDIKFSDNPGKYCSLLLKDPKFLAIIFVVIGTMFGSFWTVDMEYLEACGITWSQMFVISQFEIIFYSCIQHSLILTFNWYFNTEYYQKHGTNKDHLYNTNTISDKMLLKYEYFKSIFPSFDERETWKILIGRGVLLGCAFQFNIIALVYCNAGDVMVLRSMTTSFGMIVVGILYFDEKLTKIITFTFIFSLIGFILIVQPSFIFDSSNSDTISFIGLIFILLAGLSRVAEKSFVKISGKTKYKIHWQAMIMISFFITFILAIIVFMIMFCVYIVYYDGDTSSAWNEIWFAWYNYQYQHKYINLWVVFYGIFLLGRSTFNTIGYQMGDIGKLGIIANGDAVFTYILQAIALNEICNYLVYIGASIIVLSSIILFYEQARVKKLERTEKRLSLLQDASDNSKNNIISKNNSKNDDSGTYLSTSTSHQQS